MRLTQAGGMIRWLTRDAWGFWAALIPTAAIVCCWRNTYALTIAAGALQLAGLVVTFAGFVGDAGQFGRSLLEPAKTWWSKRPRRLTRVTATFNIPYESLATQTMTPSVGMQGNTTNARLAVLESVVTDMKKDLLKQAKAILAVKEDESRERKHALHALREMLREHASGSFHVNLLGLYWVALGTTLSIGLGLRGLHH